MVSLSLGALRPDPEMHLAGCHGVQRGDYSRIANEEQSNDISGMSR